MSQEQGTLARKAGDDFEAEVSLSFDPYRDAGIAMLDFYPVPMTPSGKRESKTGTPLYRPAGTAPFDVWGYHVQSGTIIAAELKSTKPSPSLSVIMPKLNKHGKFGRGKGTGVHFHQLEALYNIAICNGIARLVWNNGGQIGVLENEAIVNAFTNAYTAFKVEMRGSSKPKQGMKSINWEKFTEVGYGGLPHAEDGTHSNPVPLWLRHEIIR